jgi:hypothetical protein
LAQIISSFLEKIEDEKVEIDLLNLTFFNEIYLEYFNNILIYKL